MRRFLIRSDTLRDKMARDRDYLTCVVTIGKNQQDRERNIIHMIRLLVEDKLKHIVVSAIIAVTLNLFLPWWAAALITIIIGVGKEVYDKVSGKGCAEWKDLIADLVGIMIGVL